MREMAFKAKAVLDSDLNGKMKKAMLFGLMFGLLFLTIQVAFASVDVLPNSPYTTDDLNCVVNLNVTNYLIAWYKNGRDIGIEIPFVNHTLTSKHETWECRVRKYYPYVGYVPLGSDSAVINNSIPVLAQIPPIIVNETNTVVITANATDADGDVLTYIINDSRFTSNGAEFNWLTDYDDAGTHSFTITVMDDDGANVSQVATVVILNLNRAPIITDVNVSPVTAYTNDTLQCNGIYSDDDGDLEYGSTFKWFKNSTEISGVTSKTLSGDYFDKGDVITCEYTPKDGSDFGTPVNSTNPVTILNSIPYFSPDLEDQLAKEGSALIYQVHCSDADNEQLTYSSNSTQWTINSSTGLINWTPSYTDSGYYTYNITCRDSEDSTSQTFAINVTEVNTPPNVTITAPADNSSYSMLTQVNFTATATDLEDITIPPDKIIWTSSIDGNFGNDTSVNTTTLSVGYHTITLTATDSANLTGTDIIHVNITNTPPNVTITAPADNSIYEEGTLIQFTGNCTDLEESALSGDSLVWTSSIDGNFGNDTSVNTTTLSVGYHTITLTATDSANLTGTDIIHVNITAYVPDSGNIVINEFMADPSSGEDWIEIYNNDSITIEISGWTLNNTIETMATTPAGTYLNPKGFYVVNVSNSLNNTGDTIYLISSTGGVIDNYVYSSNPGTDVSVGRYPDGSSEWYILNAATPGSANVYGSLIINSWINGTFYSGSNYYNNITGIVDSIINISNITGPMINVTISNIFNSTIINSTIYNCTILNSRLENNICRNAYIDPSDIRNSDTTGSTITDSHVWDSNATYSTITDATIDNSSINNSIITNSELYKTVADNANITNGVIYNGTILMANGSIYDASIEGAKNLTELINYPPTANFSYNPSSPYEDEDVTFNSTSSDPNGDALTCTWDFGDGNTAIECSVSHGFDNDGVYTVTLTVTDAYSESDSESRSITVAEKPTERTTSRGGGGTSGQLTYIVDLAKEVTKSLKENERIKFYFNNEAHYVKVSDIDNLSVDLTITSLPIEITLAVKETNKIDLNSDNVFDLWIKLNSIVDSAANLTFKLINETVMPVQTQLSEEEKSKEETGMAEEEQPKTKEKSSKPKISEDWAEYVPEKKSELLPFIKNIVAKAKNLSLYIVRIPYAKYIGAGVILLIIILLVFPQLKRSKKKKNNKNQNKNKRNKSKPFGEKILDLFFE